MISIPVAETSQVSEARRRSVAIAQSAGFGETDAGRVAIVATELATNLIKHGGGGEMLVGLYEDPTGNGVEILALDKGRGMANVQACLRDGYSTAGTAGHGLGAVQRQSHMVDVVSWPGIGTAVLARLATGPVPRRRDAARPGWGAVSVPKLGEEACGDAWSVEDTEAGRTLFVADGLGHGPDAAEAAMEAVRVFQRNKTRRPAELLDHVHSGLRSTRGAAVSVARFEPERRSVNFAGIGNVAGVIVQVGQTKRMVSLNGTAGHNARKIQAFDYSYEAGLVILYSDGLATNWTLDAYPGLIGAHPTLVAGVLYRDFNRRRDDVTVLVASGAPG
jgi:anti-sigma regulatory factor (Ser/Thr protein kinase)